MSTYLYDFEPINGPIYSVAETSDAVYIAGEFTIYAKNSDINARGGAIINSTTAAWIQNLDFDGAANCFAIYGNDIYIGGEFQYCQGIQRAGIVKINMSTKMIDTTFDSSTGFKNGVKTLTVDSFGNIYVGGYFDSYKGVTRQKIAKLNGTTAALDTTFDTAIGFNSGVLSIKVDSSGNVYAGGGFDSYKGVTRQRIAKLNGTTAALDTTFDSSNGFNSVVQAIMLDSSGNVYAGGFFTTYNGVTRERIAKLNGTNAALDATFDSASGFNSGGIYALAADPSGNVYAGGTYATYKGVTRGNIAKINKTDASLDTTFDSASGCGSVVYSIIPDSSGNVYLGGVFNTYKGASRERIVKINGTTAAIDTTFNTVSGSNNTIYSMAIDSSGNLYVGGELKLYKKTVKSAFRMAKILKSTGLVDETFNTATSGFNSTVMSIAADSFGNIYAAGGFSAYKGTTRERIAKINGTTAALDTTFDPGVGFNGITRCLMLDSSGNVYVGGDFTSYQGTARQRIAKINGTTAALNTTFDSASGFNNGVYSLAVDSSGNVYAGGGFTAYKGTTRERIAKINGTTGALDTTFDSASGFNSLVLSIKLDSSGNVYAGGQFNTYKGSFCPRLTKLNKDTAAKVTEFNVGNGFENSIANIAVDSSENVYAVGFFTTYNGVARQGIAKINGTTGALDTTFDTASGFTTSVGRVFPISDGILVSVEMSSGSYKTKGVGYGVLLNSTTAAIRYKPQVNSVVVVGSVVVGVVDVNPTTTAILVNDQPLPVNSVVKSTSGQKFIKVEGGATAFVAIEVIPPTEWGWSQEGLDAWAVLQNL